MITTTQMIELFPTNADINRVARMIKNKKAVLAYSQKIKDRTSIQTIPNLDEVQPSDVSDNFLRSYQESALHIKMITRHRHLLQGTIESFDKDAIYMKINAQIVIVYRHSVYTITKD